MQVLRFPTYLIKIIESFLKDRVFHVSIGNSLSSELKINSGVPQGAVLSRAFSYFIQSIPVRHADLDQHDASFIHWQHSRFSFFSFYVIINNLQKASNELCRCFKRLRFRVNGQKSETLFFTRKRASRHRPQMCVKVDGSDVNWNTTIKYLGILLDPKLSYNAHIGFLITKSNKLIHALYPQINRKLKLSIISNQSQIKALSSSSS